MSNDQKLAVLIDTLHVTPQEAHALLHSNFNIEFNFYDNEPRPDIRILFESNAAVFTGTSHVQAVDITDSLLSFLHDLRGLSA